MLPKPNQSKNQTFIIAAKAICPHRGFTLIEILIVLSILSISVSYAIFYFLPTISNTKSSLLADDLLHQLQYARSEAIKRNQIVGLCGMQDTQTCSSNWNQGYLIYTKPYQQSSKKEIIKVNQYLHSDSNITSIFSATAQYIEFKPCGQSQNNGKIMVQSKSSASVHTIIVSLTGRTRRV